MHSGENEKEFNIMLINYVKDNSVIYDNRIKNHKDSSVKLAIFKKFADLHGLEADFVMKRWHNLRNSYTRIKRESRVRPDKPNMWAYTEHLKFLEPFLVSYSSSSCYGNYKNGESSKVNNEVNESNTSDENGQMDVNDDFLFTQSLSYFENSLSGNDTQNTEPTIQLEYDANDFQASINYLNGNIKKLMYNQTRQFKQLSQQISQQQLTNQPQSSFNQQQSNTQQVDLTDNVSIYLNYSLRPLLETISKDPIRFAKLQTKITQIVIEELETNSKSE